MRWYKHKTSTSCLLRSGKDSSKWEDVELTKLNNLKDEYWKSINKIVIFGFGRQGKKMYPTLKRDFEIVAIVDNSREKQGKKVDGYSILSFEQADSFLRQHKVIVTTSQYYYQTIREQLRSIGLVEKIDFIMYQQFVTEWYFKYRNKVNVLKTDISLTTLCTLNCENCMQFLPYWKEGRRKENPLEEVKKILIYISNVWTICWIWMWWAENRFCIGT